MKFREFLNENDDFNYRMLGRLQSDCDYFLKNPSENHLWALNVEDQIKEMKKLFNAVKFKPEWITMKDIKQYEKDMLKKRK